MASELNFNVQYDMVENKVMDFTYKYVGVWNEAFMTGNLCTDYIWCVLRLSKVIMNTMISIYGCYCNTVTLLTGGNFGELAFEIIIVKEISVETKRNVACESNGLLIGDSVHHCQDAEGSRAIFSWIASVSVSGLAPPSCPLPTSSAETRGSGRLLTSDISISRIECIFFLEEAADFDLNAVFSHRGPGALLFLNLLTATSWLEEGGVRESISWAILGPSRGKELEVRAWSTRLGSFCKIKLLFDSLQSVQKSSNNDVGLDIEINCVKSPANLDVEPASMRNPALLRGEETIATLGEVDIMHQIIRVSKAVNGCCLNCILRIRDDFLNGLEGRIEHKLGALIVSKASVFIRETVCRFDHQVDFLYRFDSSSRWRGPPSLTRQHSGAVTVRLREMGAVTLTITTTRTEAACGIQTGRESAVQLTRQKFCGLLATCYAITRNIENKDVGRKNFIQHDSNDYNSPSELMFN